MRARMLVVLFERLGSVRGRRGLVRLLAWAAVAAGLGGAVHLTFASATASADASRRRRLGRSGGGDSSADAASSPPVASSHVPGALVYIATLLHLLGAGVATGLSLGALFVPGHRSGTAHIRRLALGWILASGGAVYLARIARTRSRAVPGTGGLLVCGCLQVFCDCGCACIFTYRCWCRRMRLASVSWCHCVCICVGVCVCVSLCVIVSVCACFCLHACMHAYAFVGVVCALVTVRYVVCMCVCACLCGCVCVCACVCVCVCVRVFAGICGMCMRL